MVRQREVGEDTNSFSSALRSALREDPDIILVGEMRDLETISLAITAAETDILVLGTLHTASASQTIDRIIDVFPTSKTNANKSTVIIFINRCYITNSFVKQLITKEP